MPNPTKQTATSEESPCHLLRYILGFFFQRFPRHDWIVLPICNDGYGENLVSNNANDLLSIALSFAVHSTGHRFISDGAQRRNSGAAPSLVRRHCLLGILYLFDRDLKLTRRGCVMVGEVAGCPAAFGE